MLILKICLNRNFKGIYLIIVEQNTGELIWKIIALTVMSLYGETNG